MRDTRRCTRRTSEASSATHIAPHVPAGLHSGHIEAPDIGIPSGMPNSTISITSKTMTATFSTSMTVPPTSLRGPLPSRVRGRGSFPDGSLDGGAYNSARPILITVRDIARAHPLVLGDFTRPRNAQPGWGLFSLVEVALDPSKSARDDSFVSFFEAEYDGLYRAMLLMAGSRSEADEIAQEAMARVYERWDRVSDMASPAGYAYTIAFNLNRRRLRHLIIRRRQVTHEPEPTSLIDAIDAGRDVRAALLRLPLPLREAVVLTSWLELSAEESGGILGIEAVSVRGRLHRARQLLRELLEEIDG
jgi:RNA polymerase sigma factor (sigma-70 family)